MDSVSKVALAAAVLAFAALFLSQARPGEVNASVDCNVRDAFNILLVNVDLAEPEKLNVHGSQVRIVPNPRNGSGEITITDGSQDDFLVDNPGVIQVNEACVTTGDAYVVQLIEVPGCSNLPPPVRLTVVAAGENQIEFETGGCRSGRPAGSDEEPGEGPAIAMIALGAISVFAVLGGVVLIMMARRNAANARP